MSKWLDQEEPTIVSKWYGGHKRPSTVKTEHEWACPKPGVHTRVGWSIVETEVQNCLPKSHAAPGIMYRVFPPGAAKHVGSFTLLGRAKYWTDHTAIPESHGTVKTSKK